jgi:hypothetical protein
MTIVRGSTESSRLRDDGEVDTSVMVRSLDRVEYVMLQHLHATWHRARRERVDPHLTIEAEERRFSLVRSYDPTGGLYHAWLSAWRRRLWDERGFFTTLGGEELGRVNQALSHFHAMRNRLPTDLRDIGQYRTVQDLRSVVPTRVAENRRRLEAEVLKSNAQAQSETLFHEGRWRAVRLHGFAAARFWGLGTRWCTTSNEATFEQYSRGSMLIVVITPHGRYQLQMGGQCRDQENLEPGAAAFKDAPGGLQTLLRSWR